MSDLNKAVIQPSLGKAIMGTAPASLEGTAILSTGESGGTKVLTEQGDGTSAWAAPAGGAPEGTAVLSTGETLGKVLRADGDNTCSWVALAGGGDMLAANNLSDVASATTSATNLGLGTADSPTWVGATFTGDQIFLGGATAGDVLLEASNNVLLIKTGDGLTGAVVNMSAVVTTGGSTIGGDLRVDGNLDFGGVSTNPAFKNNAGVTEVRDIQDANYKDFKAANITTDSGTVDGVDVAALGAANTGDETTESVRTLGALMDDECTALASVKALDQGVASTDSPSFANVDLPSDGEVRTGTGTLDAVLRLTNAFPPSATFETGDAASQIRFNALFLALASTGILFNLNESATEPPGPSDGDTYLDDGTNTISGLPGFRRYNVSAWEDLCGETTATITALGALMDSEVTNLAQVKAFDTTDYATAAQGTTADAALPKAGGTMTGKLQFSGTTFAPIELLSLTTTERNALTPVEGDLIYNETDSQIQGYMGAAWTNLGGGAGGGDPDQNLWSTIAADSGTSPVPDGITDTLTLAGGTGVDTAGDSGTDTVTVNLNAASIASLALADTSVQPSTSPTLTGTNFTGTAASLTAGNVTTNANLTGHVTSVGNAAVLGSFTVAQLSTALSDATISGNNSGDESTATASAEGIVELATQAEVDAGTDTARVVTCETLNGWDGTGAVEQLGIAISDETTDLTTGTAKSTFRMPFAMTLTGVRASVNTAPVGSTLIVDINDGGSTIMTTNKLSIDASEKTSETAATAPGITDSALADDAEITIDIDQIGSSTAGKGLKIWLIGTRT